MKLLLRLWLLLVLGSYLLGHHRLFPRENPWPLYSLGGRELLNRVPGIAKDHSQDTSAQQTCRLESCHVVNLHLELSIHELRKATLEIPSVGELHGDRQTALQVHQCDETPINAGLRSYGQHPRITNWIT